MGETVAVLFGGPSNEHEISCLSAITVMQALAAAGHLVYPVAVDRDLTWRHTPAALSEFQEIGTRLPTTSDLTGSSITTVAADIAFPVLHGSWGEDGGVQQVLTELQIPFVGSGVLASKTAMDKAATKTVLAATGIQVLPAVTVTEANWQQQQSAIAQLGENLFVKPSHGGSSLGVSHVTSSTQLAAALKKVFELSDSAIVELAISNPREIEIGVLQHADGKVVLSRCGEIKLKPEFDFYDYQAKYLADGAELIVPADLDEIKYQAIAEIAKQAFVALNCAGLARVDFLMAKDGTVYLNEVNTMPGFTQISMYPKMFAATGILLPELVSKLVAHGLAASR
jgi:D-alanine-D-alanine ligase